MLALLLSVSVFLLTSCSNRDEGYKSNNSSAEYTDHSKDSFNDGFDDNYNDEEISNIKNDSNSINQRTSIINNDVKATKAKNTVKSSSNESKYKKSSKTIEVDNNAESSKFETVLFGNIEWIVLDYDNSKALLLTKDITELRPYHNDVENVTWEKCTLRSYLNNTWFNNTFSESEKKRILATYVNNNDNNEYGTPGGNDTKDKVFLLSIDEVKKFFSTDSERIAFYRGEAERWWLRSPGDYRDHAADITNHGHIHSNGQYVYESAENWGGWSVGVRPAILIDLNS